MARGVRFLLGSRQYPFLKKNGPGIPVFGYCPFFKARTCITCLIGSLSPSDFAFLSLRKLVCTTYRIVHQISCTKHPLVWLGNSSSACHTKMNCQFGPGAFTQENGGSVYCALGAFFAFCLDRGCLPRIFAQFR